MGISFPESYNIHPFRSIGAIVTFVALLLKGGNVHRRINRLRKLKSNAVKRAADAKGEELKGTKTSGRKGGRENGTEDARLAKLSFILTIVDITRYRAPRAANSADIEFRYLYIVPEIFCFKPYFKYLE